MDTLKKQQLHLDLRIDSNKNIYKDYSNSALIRDNNTDLVHYSLAARGSALYYQKMVITKLFRQSFIKDKLKTNHYYLTEGYAESARYLNFGTNFQQKYCLLTSVHQIRRNMVNGVFNNDAYTIGTFKNFMNNNHWSSGNSFFKRSKELKKTYNFKRMSWSYTANVNVNLHFLFSDKMPNAFKTMEMKSKFFIPNLQNIFWFKNDMEFIKMKEFLSRSTGSLTHFIRTIWYRLTLSMERSKYLIGNGDYSRMQRVQAIKSESYRMLFTSKIKNSIFLTLGSYPKKQIDLQKALKIKMRWNHRHFVKKHISWRLGLKFWGCKILHFKKGYLFWKFARGLTKYYYRGYKATAIFNNRADMYILRHFNILSLKFARVLIMSRHIFIGNYPIRMPETVIAKNNMVTLSKIANIYLSKRKYFKTWKNKKNRELFKVSRHLTKSAPLRFCRQQKDLAFWGTIKNTRYILNYGPNLNLLNMESKKTKFFALNYFFVQKAVTTSWW